MPHIHTDPGQHDLTASAFIIRVDLDEPKILLHMHKKLHKWLQFGGHVELHENPWQAVLHEIKEESGYEISQLSILQPKDRFRGTIDATIHPQPMTINTHAFGPQVNHFHTDLAFAFIANQPPRQRPDNAESSELQLFSSSEIKELNNIPENARQIALHALEIYRGDWEAIDTKTFVN